MNKNKNNKNNKGKQLRKPISNNFAPKRLAINFDPPMISMLYAKSVIEYLVVDTGKLYHHKMRLDSILKKPKVTRDNVLNYIKTKHHLYFASGKIKDSQLIKFIDKLLYKKGLITKAQLNNIQQAPNIKQQPPKQSQQHDFDYLNDDDQEEYYQQDYQDYEDPNYVPQKQEPQKQTKQTQQAKKNAFLAYCQEYEEEQGENQPQASWDLDMDENDDFV